VCSRGADAPSPAALCAIARALTRPAPHTLQNGTLASVAELVSFLNGATLPDASLVEVVVAPSMLHVASVAATLRPDIAVCGQNAWHGACGAFTGEVAAEQLRDAGATWVLLGHSERRAASHESDDYVSIKVHHAQEAGLAVLACVGETLAQRNAGETLAVVDAQMRAIAARLDASAWGDRFVVAYEPVWAIGTGLVATPQQAQEVHAELRRWLRCHVGDHAADATRIIYGGSVVAASARELAAQQDVDGFLVGGASLKHAFVDIIAAALPCAGHHAAAAEGGCG
jgi:triosephosphate isomerase